MISLSHTADHEPFLPKHQPLHLDNNCAKAWVPMMGGCFVLDSQGPEIPIMDGEWRRA